jgi:Na+-transporting NADH:ubiquinone oxidoreductase subunit A
MRVKIRRGLNLRLVGEAEKITTVQEQIDTVRITPADFHPFTPKLLVQAGDEVKAGTPIFFLKELPDVKVCSPVSGEVVEIERGEKRRILGIKILADKSISYRRFEPFDYRNADRQALIQRLCEMGLWPFFRQRPFDVVANPHQVPKAIVVSAFDTAPLAPDMDFIVHGNGPDFQAGLDLLTRLTPGKVHLNVHETRTRSDIFLNARNVTINIFSGPHPASNPGVQIHHLDPINKGEVVWTISVPDLLCLGKSITENQFVASRVVALTGSEMLKRRYVKTVIGASLKNLLAGNITHPDSTRIISGNVLTGRNVGMDGHLGYYHSHITAIPEAQEPELLGWIAPGFGKFSMSHSYFSWLMPGKKYVLNSGLQGEKRPFVVTGEYEKVFPMDIYPVQLVKAILANDLELMENLGAYEVAPEDFALCEFVCTSKIPVQKIVREGLDILMKETA